MASALAKLPLPHLTSLDLSKTDLTAAAMSQLASVDLPVLRYLDLGHNQLDASGVYWLVQGNWPLKDLHLSHNRLDANAVQHLVNGVWPSLQFLSQAGNPLGQRGVKELTKGNWPQLKHLDVDLQMLDSHSAVELGLNPDKTHDLHSTLGADHDAYLTTNDLRTGNSSWPSLSNILVL